MADESGADVSMPSGVSVPEASTLCRGAGTFALSNELSLVIWVSASCCAVIGKRPTAWFMASTITEPIAEPIRAGSKRRRWLGVSAGLSLGRPAWRTPGYPGDHPGPTQGAAIQSDNDEDQSMLQPGTPGVRQERHSEAELHRVDPD